jgi:hypothetical protein
MAQTSDVVDVYWFAGYNYYGATPEFCLHPHPTQGGYFANDSVAGDLDEIAAYGCLGFVTSGSLPCPAPLGACCRDDGSCDLLSETDCLAEDSTVWMGPEVPCDPDPCIPVPTLKSTWGTVKRAFRL